MRSRRHAVSRDVAWLSGDRRFPGEPRFPGLAAVALVEAEVGRPGQAPSRERRYFLSSAPRDAPTFARAARAHWGIEDRPHWVMDVVFRDDLCRLRTGHGPANMATVRHMAVNLVRTAPGRHSLEVRRKRAAWDVGYLAALYHQTASRRSSDCPAPSGGRTAARRRPHPTRRTAPAAAR